ncbi:winged helix-turn-helix transcriptional regulator [Gynuella sp.]|uniref:ROK family transcriptional regulator n=1 Tax=Gynuella sp. TaxID=2969146 RepID=UPI003D0E716A
MNRLFGRRRQEKKTAQAEGPGYSHLDIANRNMRVVLEALRRDGPYSRQELSVLTGLTQTALTTILRKLQSAGYVDERRRQKNEGERYTQSEFLLNPDGALTIGVRVRSHHSELVLLDLCGHIRRHQYCMELPALIGGLQEFRLLAENQGKCVGLGVVFDADVDVDFDLIKDAVGDLPCYQRRDIGAAVMAEHLLGHHNTGDGAVLVVIDETVRAGLLVGGQPFEGFHGLAGRIGLMRTGRDRAQLNDILSIQTLQPLLPPLAWDLLSASASTPFDWTPELEEWARNAAVHLLDATIAIAGFLAPGVILIGGDLPTQMIERLIQEMRAEQQDRKMSTWMPDVRAASFVHAGIAAGAAVLPFQERLLPYAGY